MPVIPSSSYRAPFAFRNGHLQTVYPALFRRVPIVTCERERIQTPDADFLDLDWNHCVGSKKLIVLSHGLEGSSHQAYIQGMAQTFHLAGWNVLAWNFRGCSGEPNHQLKSYHSGATGELQIVLHHVFEQYDFESISLAGFSLGGNITLKYLGERANDLDTRIHSAVAISVPCDLESSSLQLESLTNRIYMLRFMRTLRLKIRQKMEHFPDQIDDNGLDTMASFREFDGAYTAPIHGFIDAKDYWTRSSSKPVLDHITVPTLLINALDDPFLAPLCYPWEEANRNDKFFLETPKHGGHNGFVSFGRNKAYWSENRALQFVEEMD